MSRVLPRIEQLAAPVAEGDVRDLAALLLDAIAAGAAVSFLDSLTLDGAMQWWRETLATPRALFFVARDEHGIVGTVQLHPAWAPNQPHRAELVKLLVHRRARRAGIASRLMDAAEDAARRAGYTLLTLDAKAGGAAEQLYRERGWISVGVIPAYALDPDGTPHDAVFFYRQLPAAQHEEPAT